jgi:hypothetical protein
MAARPRNVMRWDISDFDGKRKKGVWVGRQIARYVHLALASCRLSSHFPCECRLQTKPGASSVWSICMPRVWLWWVIRCQMRHWSHSVAIRTDTGPYTCISMHLHRCGLQDSYGCGLAKFLRKQSSVSSVLREVAVSILMSEMFLYYLWWDSRSLVCGVCLIWWDTPNVPALPWLKISPTESYQNRGGCLETSQVWLRQCNSWVMPKQFGAPKGSVVH